MAVKILRITDVSGTNWNNLINENGNICACVASVRFADKFVTYARVLAESVAESGWGYYLINNISSRVTINSVKVFGTFRAGPEIPNVEEGSITLAIKTHGICYFTASPSHIPIATGETKTTSKIWTTNPHTSSAWTVSEVNNIVLYFILCSGYYAEPEEDLKVDCDVGYIEVNYESAIPLVSTRDETDITNSSAMLNGEITDDGGGCTERGFEYYREGDPGNVITIKETGEFGNGEYGLTAGGLLAGTEYHFRAYALNEADVGYGSWKSFVTTALPPTVSTQEVTNIKIDNATGHGTIESTGGQPGVYKCVERGFEVRLEYSGSLGQFAFLSVAGFSGSVGFNLDTGNWEGILVKTIKEGGNFDAGEYELWLARTPRTVFSDKLFAGISYSCRAYAINEDDLIGYGGWVDFTTLEAFGVSSRTDGLTTEIESITVQNLEEGAFATRIGIRYGTTSSANEFDIHTDGEFGNGIYEFILSDLISNTKYYKVPYLLIEDGGQEEGSLVEGETLPEEPEDEFTTLYYGPHGQDYREVVKKVFAEKLSTQPIIDFNGGKKTLKLNNHLIQEQNNALIIADNYLNRFQFAKTKLVVEYATPMPFEREDTIDFDYGNICFKPDGEGIVLFRADGQGQMNILNMISVIVRKINLKMGITEKTVEYLATLELEEE